MFKSFAFSLTITMSAIILAYLTFGFGAALTTLVLIAVEIAFSFDNAIINAKILERLSGIWQQLFLTIGMILAIVGMRIIFPIAIVMITAHLSWQKVIDDALHHPSLYGQHLQQAHASISAYGGSFLLLLALYFLFDEARSEVWLRRIEHPLQKLGGSIWLPPLLVAIIMIGISVFAGQERGEVLHAGIMGIVSYTLIRLLIESIGKFTGNQKGTTKYQGWAAFVAFIYLQVLDASFSFDGVLGAFAITDKILLIALGLGVGAVWVRSLTVFMVKRGTLSSYIYLEHGAHYAILILAVALLSSIFFEIPNAVTGIAGLGVIGASFITSRQALHAKSQR